MIGMIYAPTAQASNVESAYPLIDLYWRYKNSYPNPYSALNADAFEAQFAVEINATMTDWGRKAFDFCGFDCAILNLLVADKFSLTMNEYYSQFANASCQSPFDAPGWYVL